MPEEEIRKTEEYMRGFKDCQRRVCDALNEIEAAKQKSKFVQSQFAYDVAAEIVRRVVDEEELQ